jgi:hypothetical protein
VAEEELGEAVTRAQQIGANVLAAPQEIADCFLLVRGHVNRRQRSRAKQHGELPGVAPVGLDAITGPAWDQCRRHDLAGNPLRAHRALQLEAAGAGFVTASDGPDLAL